MWDFYWPYWEFSVETKGGLCFRGINLFPHMGAEGKKKEDYPCQYFKFVVTRDWMSRGNRKEIQSLSLLGHWLKSCLFQQWPKLITIQACCSVTNSMWKELVASEAGAQRRQPQQKVQGLGSTLNMNVEYECSAQPRASVPAPATSQVRLSPNRLDCLDWPWTWLITLPLLDHPWTTEGSCAVTSFLCSPAWVTWGQCPAPKVSACHAQLPTHLPSRCSLGRAPWGNVGKDTSVLFITTSVDTPAIHRLLSGTLTDYGTEKLTFGQWATFKTRISLCMSGGPREKNTLLHIS